MKKSYISTERIHRGKPAVAFFLSLLWTGAGEFRYGKKSAGTVLMLLRALPFLVFPVMLTADPESSLMAPLLLSVAGALAVTIYSPVRAAVLLKSKSEIPEEKMTSPLVLILYILCNTALTLGAVAATLSFFSLHRAADNRNIPSIAAGDILLVSALPPEQLPEKGNMILLKTGTGYRAWRIIADRPLKISIKKGQFTLQGRELSISPPDEDTAAAFPGAPGENMLIEENGMRRYPVLVNTEKEKDRAGKKDTVPEKDEIQVTDGQVLLSQDDRRGEKFYLVKKKEELRLKVIGILFHTKGIGFPSVPWL